MATVKVIEPNALVPEHLRVAAYCRVSSDSDADLDGCRPAPYDGLGSGQDGDGCRVPGSLERHQDPPDVRRSCEVAIWAM